MDNNIEATDSQPVEETTSQPAAPVVPQTDAELVKKNQELFARAKKAEEKLKELSEGKVSGIDPDALRKEIDAKVDLRLAGHSQEEISEMEKYAKGAGISLTEAAQSPFVKKAVEAIRAEKRSTESTPAPSSRIKTFNGKPIDDVLLNGTAAEKQAAFMAKIKGGVKSNE